MLNIYKALLKNTSATNNGKKILVMVGSHNAELNETYLTTYKIHKYWIFEALRYSLPNRANNDYSCHSLYLQ